MTTRNWVVLAGAVALLWPSVAAAGPQEKAMAQSIAQQVKESGKLSKYRLGVSVQNGVATLEGEVTSKKQALAAVNIARQTPGVEQVMNRLSIVGATPQKAHANSEKSNGLLMSLNEAIGKPAGRSSLKTAPKRLQAQQPQLKPTNTMPMPMQGVQNAAFQQARVQQAQCACNGGYAGGGYAGGGYAPGGHAAGGGVAAVGYDNANLPGYAWPSYAAYPNYSALTYPKQYSPTAWPYIGPFYPYPQVPLGWRKVSLEWDDGWWFLDFSHHQCQ